MLTLLKNEDILKPNLFSREDAKEKMEHDKTVYIVHAVDTEGPLYESLSATFETLHDIFGISMEPSHANLEKLRGKQVDLNGREDVVAEFVDPFRLSYNETWDSIDRMLSNIMSPEFRNQYPDSFGRGWVYNWHCVDHVGYEVNPRRKDLGIHNIHDRYAEFMDKYNSTDLDTLAWHFHPMSTYREAHRCATSYENSSTLHQVICRRILERDFFPSVFRAGFDVERPDSHWFLEQWIPFDCSNVAKEDFESDELQNDFKDGRFGDWRRAPTDWSVYNPDFYDYQKPGSCKRYIGRFLFLNSRVSKISQEEVDKAFHNTQMGKKLVLGVLSHDYRDMADEVKLFLGMLENSVKKYPDVKFKFCKSKDAFNEVVHGGGYEKLNLDVQLQHLKEGYKLKVTVLSGEVFGPQPYLAIKTRGGRFIHDNFDFGLDGKTWFYVFDADSVLSADLEAVGVAANNKYGDTFIKKINFGSESK